MIISKKKKKRQVFLLVGNSAKIRQNEKIDTFFDTKKDFWK